MRVTAKFLLRTTALALVALTAACGGDDGDDNTGPSTPPPAESGTGFTLTNSSDRAAWYVFTRSCDATSWGEDELGSANILQIGESATIDETAGCYDVIALTSRAGEPRYQVLLEDRTVTANQRAAIAFSSGAWAEVTDPAIASLSIVKQGR